MSTANTNDFDPNTMFQQLVNEVRETASNEKTASEAEPDAGTEKIANNSGTEFDLAFFDKLAANDADATEALSVFVNQSLDAGHSEDEIAAFIDKAENAARKTAADGGGDGDEQKPADDGAKDPEASEFDLAVEQSENEAIEMAIDDELSSNPMAKAAGIDRKTLEGWLIGQAGGEAYVNGRKTTEELIGKIASQILPDDSMVEDAIQALKERGLDVSAVEEELSTLMKQASEPQTESDSAKKAREIAESEQALVESLTVLKCAGVDVEELVKQAEEKKKMSAGKKALIAGGTLAALAGGGYLAKRHSGTIATGAVSAANKAKSGVGAAVNKAKDVGEKARYQATLARMSLRK